jgi:hypothetical protein
VSNRRTVEAVVRSMTKTERVEYLRAHGWTRISYRDSQSWRAPDPDDHGFYTLAAAIRTEISHPGREATKGAP